ncbi:MAG: VCBS repeat-containing protein, partial [Rhodothermales bacterium]|nr:VCBS repeat-containing protein [Rhodothermales bacterium]
MLLGILALGPRSAAAQVFVERGVEAGLTAAVHTTGVAVADYDGDGDLDLYTVAASQHVDGQPDTYSRLFRNEGDGTFLDVTEVAGVRAPVFGFPDRYMGNRFGASWADFDSDGDPDLLITQIGPEILFENNGDGTFSDISDLAGINRGAPPADTTETAGATWLDYDRDGLLDVYLNNWNGPNRFYRNTGGEFEEVGIALGVADTSRTWTTMPLDANHDGWPDLYLANDFGPNALYLSQGGQSFTDATLEYRVGDEGHGMGLAVGDINGDLLLDLYVTNIAQTIYQNVLFVGLQGPPYEEVASFLGV